MFAEAGYSRTPPYKSRATCATARSIFWSRLQPLKIHATWTLTLAFSLKEFHATYQIYSRYTLDLRATQNALQLRKEHQSLDLHALDLRCTSEKNFNTFGSSCFENSLHFRKDLQYLGSSCFRSCNAECVAIEKRTSKHFCILISCFKYLYSFKLTILSMELNLY